MRSPFPEWRTHPLAQINATPLSAVAGDQVPSRAIRTRGLSDSSREPAFGGARGFRLTTRALDVLVASANR